MDPGWAGTPWRMSCRRPAQARRRTGRTDPSTPAGREHHVHRVGRPGEGGQRRLDRGLVRDVGEARHRRAERLDLVPDASLEVAVRRSQGLLTTTPTRIGRNGATHTRAAGRRATATPASTPTPPRRGRTFTEPPAARRPRWTVERREHLERVDPVEQPDLARPDVDDAVVRRDEVDPALVRAALLEARLRTAAARRRAASSSWRSPGSRTRIRPRRRRPPPGRRRPATRGPRRRADGP
jgi:hypothetical protein